MFYHWHVNYFFTNIEPETKDVLLNSTVKLPSETKLKMVITYICSALTLFLSYQGKDYFVGSTKIVFEGLM